MRYLKKELNGQKRDDLQNVKFTQLKHFKHIYLYKRSDGEYEVIKAIKKKGRGIFYINGVKKISVDHHQYPRGNDWNEYHTRDYNKAVKHFELLSERYATND